jgi:hypothetical protein
VASSAVIAVRTVSYCSRATSSRSTSSRVALLLHLGVLGLRRVTLEVGLRLGDLGVPLGERGLGRALLGRGRVTGVASICRRLASKGRGSMVNSGWPCLTSWPSAKCTRTIWPATCDFTPTVL